VLYRHLEQILASAGDDLVYLWGGVGDTEPEGCLYTAMLRTETWMRQLSKGPLPPSGLFNGGCTIAGQYFYECYSGRSYCGDLYEPSWRRRKLCDGGAGGPGKKMGCKMTSYQDKLLVIGFFYGTTPSLTQGGVHGRRIDEVHSYNLTTGKR